MDLQLILYTIILFTIIFLVFLTWRAFQNTGQENGIKSTEFQKFPILAELGDSEAQVY